MTEEQARKFFDGEQIDLVNDVVTGAVFDPAWNLPPARRPQLIGLLRRLLVNEQRLRAYCRLLINRRADRPAPPVSDTVMDLVLRNQLEQITDSDLLRLATDLDGLSVLRQVIQEEHGEEWVEAYTQEGADHLKALKASGETFRSADDLLRDLGVAREDGGASAGGDAAGGDFEILIERDGMAAALRETRSLGMKGVEPLGVGEPGSGIISELEAEEIGRPRSATRWVLRDAGGSADLVLPASVAERCYGSAQQSVRLVLKVRRIDRASGKAVLRAAVKPAPSRGEFALTLRLRGGECAEMKFPRSDEPSSYSEESNLIAAGELPVRMARARLELR